MPPSADSSRVRTWAVGPFPTETNCTIVPAFVDANILTWRVVENTGDLLLAGIRSAAALKISFWDALVMEAALAGGCDRLWTEDLQHGQRVRDLTIVNPFLPEPPRASR
jgi:predicted nucleic acid-binding protein